MPMKRQERLMILVCGITLGCYLVKGTAGAAQVQKTPDTSASQERPFSLKVDVNLVVLNVTVLDERGANVTTLKQHDFVIYEDDVEQEIANFAPVEAPFHLVLALDNSSSTRTSLPLIKKAALNFVNELRPDDRIAITELNFFVRQLQDFTSDRKTLARALQKIVTYPFGGSKVYDGVALGLQQLRNAETGRKAIVILSDGMENSSSLKFEDLRRLLAQGDAVLYPVTILNKDRQKNLLESYIRSHKENDPYVKNARESLSVLEEVYQIQTERLQTVSEETGGRIFLVGNLADLAGEYSKVAQELRNTFSLAYYSKNQWNDGVMRKIRVEVKEPRYRVHSRTTYFVPKRD
jgi:Ca-activated chloride channel family protein